VALSFKFLQDHLFTPSLGALNDDSYNIDPPSMAVAHTSSYTIDPNWYVDTGATDHITSDLDRLALRERYHGGEQVQVGNGACLQILHSGHSTINSDHRPLTLRNILHVPDISKNLLSVQKFHVIMMCFLIPSVLFFN
jgi:hypothetical protein